LGTYRCVAVNFAKWPPRSYGAAFILLDPQTGDAYLAKDNGRAGLAIHGGDPDQNGALRATEGCLRLYNDVALELGRLVDAEIKAGRDVPYACLHLVEPPAGGPDGGPASVEKVSTPS